MERKSGERTLLASVLLSSPGPIVLGAALLMGRSATQLADFVRRTAELGATLVSLVIYRILYRRGGADQQQKERLERTAGTCVGLAMCLSGAAMALIALLAKGAMVGNVLPALIIASLGGLTNLWFWLRYRKLHRQTADVILASQGKLYGAKTLVDACVTLALGVVFFAPHTAAAAVVDMIGSAAVAAYLVVNGVVTIRSASVGGAAGT